MKNLLITTLLFSSIANAQLEHKHGIEYLSPIKLAQTNHVKYFYDEKFAGKLMLMQKTVRRLTAAPDDTHLTNSVSELKLTFTFKPIESPNIDNIGFAPSGKYINGWDGVAQFFKSPELGSCKYSYNHIVYVGIDTSKVEFIINKNPTESFIEGDNKNGHLYTIEWFLERVDKQVIDRKLECANTQYDKYILYKMLLLAKSI